MTCLRGQLSQSWFLKTTERIPGLIPHAQIKVIEGANHAVTFHQPAQLAQAVREAAATARP